MAEQIDDALAALALCIVLVLVVVGRRLERIDTTWVGGQEAIASLHTVNRVHDCVTISVPISRSVMHRG